jgi:hypothetical protein
MRRRRSRAQCVVRSIARQGISGRPTLEAPPIWRGLDANHALAEGFVPVVVETMAAGCSLLEPPVPPPPTRPHLIELNVAGTSVFIWRGAEPAMVSAIIGALKAAK